jgi:hypothetical protein
MKATKVSRKIEILSTFFRLGLIITFLASCDVLESDPDVLEPAVEITGEEVYVLSNGTSFIDLQSRVQSNLEARLAVTTSPSHGTLTDLGKGIIQYAPKAGNTRVKDGFEVTVFSTNNEILKKDTVVIIVENDSTKLPCSIYPVNDYVHNVTSPVAIDVTANDIICSGDVIVSVYRPENTFPPYYGTATVSGKKIVYTPGASFSGEDKLMYKLTAANDPKLSAYGMVYVSGDSSCMLRLNDDQLSFGGLLAGSTINLPVFGNDEICGALNLFQVNIKTNPLFGKAFVTSDEVYYVVPDSAGYALNDHFTYEVCLDAVCKTARVDMKYTMVHSLNCRITAVSDSIPVEVTTSTVYLDVLQNDSICTQMKTFEITKSPQYGTASVNLDKKQIEYTADPFSQTDDWLDYKICDDEWCSTTTVHVIRKK